MRSLCASAQNTFITICVYSVYLDAPTRASVDSNWFINYDRDRNRRRLHRRTAVVMIRLLAVIQLFATGSYYICDSHNNIIVFVACLNACYNTVLKDYTLYNIIILSRRRPWLDDGVWCRVGNREK